MVNIEAHSVRSAATTYALLKGVQVQHIMEAADFASLNTFINHYFRSGIAPGLCNPILNIKNLIVNHYKQIQIQQIHIVSTRHHRGLRLVPTRVTSLQMSHFWRDDQ